MVPKGVVPFFVAPSRVVSLLSLADLDVAPVSLPVLSDIASPACAFICFCCRSLRYDWLFLVLYGQIVYVPRARKKSAKMRN